jgi:hypothetical protein
VGGDGQVLAKDGNRTIELRDPTAHAEILVMRAAAQALGLLERACMVVLWSDHGFRLGERGAWGQGREEGPGETPHGE